MAKKTGVFYKTRYGSTKEYAQILAKALKCKALEFDDKDLSKYDRVIVMSGTYAGQMPLTGFLVRNWKVLKNKEVTTVATGLVSQKHLWSKITYCIIISQIFWINLFFYNENRSLSNVNFLILETR